MNLVIYLLDNINFKDYGICVSNSSNLFEKTSFKDSLKKDWGDEHGFDIDLNNRYRNERILTIECFIPSENIQDCISKYNEFMHKIDAKGSRRLSVLFENLRMEFQVYRSESSDVRLQYDDAIKVGVFTLKLIENMPVKKVLKSTSKTTSVKINSNKIMIINWGDGTQRYTITGDNTYTKDYSDDKEYFPIILGDIDSISSFETNADILWNKY